MPRQDDTATKVRRTVPVTKADLILDPDPPARGQKTPRPAKKKRGREDLPLLETMLGEDVFHALCRLGDPSVLVADFAAAGGDGLDLCAAALAAAAPDLAARVLAADTPRESRESACALALSRLVSRAIGAPDSAVTPALGATCRFERGSVVFGGSRWTFTPEGVRAYTARGLGGFRPETDWKDVSGLDLAHG